MNGSGRKSETARRTNVADGNGRAWPAVLAVLLTCLVSAMAGCSDSSVTNNGNCDAGGVSNGVTCVASPRISQSPSNFGSASASADGSSPSANSTPDNSGTASQGPAAGVSLPSAKKVVSVMAPITSQPGWSLVWHGQDSIGPQGVLFTEVNPNSGPAAGTGDNYDLQYIPGSGWNSGLNYLYYWTENYQPGPATITGLLNGNFSGQDPSGMPANVGDQIFAAMDTEAEGFDIAFCLQVTKVDQSGVLVNMWIWNNT